MKLLADLHISPHTVTFLESIGHDVARVTDTLPATTSDDAIVALAATDERVILTQDLDFSAIIALSHRARPSVITLRLNSSRVDNVNAVLQRVLSTLEQEQGTGFLVTVTERAVRRRALPLR